MNNTITSEIWDKYRNDNIIDSNDQLIGMMQEVLNSINIIKNIKSPYYIMLCHSLCKEWYRLSLIADARNIHNYPR